MWNTVCSPAWQLIPSMGWPVTEPDVAASTGPDGTGTSSGPGGPAAGAAPPRSPRGVRPAAAGPAGAAAVAGPLHPLGPPFPEVFSRPGAGGGRQTGKVG